MSNFFATLSKKTWYPKVKDELFSWVNTFIAATTLMAIISIQQIDLNNIDTTTGLAALGVIIRTAVKYGLAEVLKLLIKKLEVK